jgi:hypothetical protein
MDIPAFLADSAKVVVPGIVVAVVASLVTVRLSIGRFHAEKWWERKEEAYSNLIDIMYSLKNYTTKHLAHEQDPERFTKGEREIWESEWREFGKRYDRARSLASLHLSKEAMAVLKTYEDEKARAGENDDLYRWMDDDLSACTKCLEALIAAAKADLRVK